MRTLRLFEQRGGTESRAGVPLAVGGLPAIRETSVT